MSSKTALPTQYIQHQIGLCGIWSKKKSLEPSNPCHVGCRMAETGTNRDIKRISVVGRRDIHKSNQDVAGDSQSLHGKLCRGKWAAGQTRQGNSQWTEVSKGGLCWATHLGDSWEFVTCPPHPTTRAPDGQRVSLCPKVYCASFLAGETVVPSTGLVRSKVHRQFSHGCVMPTFLCDPDLHC